MRALSTCCAAALVAVGCGDGSPRAATAPPVTGSSATAAPTRVAAKPPQAIRFTVVASGDFLIHQPVWDRALALGGGRRYDFRPMFRAVRPIVRAADLAICHVETPLQPGAPQGYPVFRTPPDLARGIKSTGWDVCSTASNH